MLGRGVALMDIGLDLLCTSAILWYVPVFLLQGFFLDRCWRHFTWLKEGSFLILLEIEWHYAVQGVTFCMVLRPLSCLALSCRLHRP